MACTSGVLGAGNSSIDGERVSVSSETSSGTPSYSGTSYFGTPSTDMSSYSITVRVTPEALASIANADQKDEDDSAEDTIEVQSEGGTVLSRLTTPKATRLNYLK